MSAATAETLRVVVEPLECLIGLGVGAVLERRGHRVVARGTADAAPDVVVLVAGLDGMPARDLVATVAVVARGCPVAVIGAFRESGEIEGVLSAGALGCVSALDSAEAALHAVEAVARRRGYLSPQVADLLVQGELHARRADAALTPREREVLRLVGQGHATREIARALGLSPKTVQAHRAALMAKLGAANPAALLREAVRRGLAT